MFVGKCTKRHNDILLSIPSKKLTGLGQNPKVVVITLLNPLLNNKALAGQTMALKSN